MNNFLKFSLLSINTPPLTEEIKSVSLPTVNGIITILPNHTNLITALESGILTLKKLNDEKVYYAILGGIGIISKNEVRVITNLFEKGSVMPEVKEKFSQWEIASIETNEKLEEKIKLQLLKIIREWKSQKRS
ncbi:MAG: F0F1 ATP synthase subunit epsilon [Candidatus Hydrogenedentes bacterium]|nr:F0F1 ATP synthase subunit epsilon [Candidatus Hydrogenedentota bacterium]